jgi:hypothetical protein
MENDIITAFTNKMKSEHNKRGVKLGRHYLEGMELSEAWDKFANTVQMALKNGSTPKDFMLGMVNVANDAMYVHAMLEREDGKTLVYKIAEERKKRVDTLNVRRVGQ